MSSNSDNKFIWRCCGCSIDNRRLCTSCACGIVTIGAILLVALLALSIKNVDENEMAIPYDKVSRSIGDVLEAGKHVLSPSTKLFKYDRKFITNNIDVECITKDGLFITLKVTQQYQFKKEELTDVLFEFGEQKTFDNYIDTIAQDTIRDVCALFKGEEYFSKRNDVEAKMILDITTAMTSANTHVIPGFVQLRNIALPVELLNIIKNKQIALEEKDVANNERLQQLIQKDTERREVQLDAQIKLIAVNATANGIVINAKEKATARLIQWAERANAFLIDLEALNINPTVYVDNYLFPRLRANTLTPEQQSCLQTCPAGTACWYCFTTATPAIVA